MFPEATQALARRVLDAARARGLTVASAESCTGGLVAAALCAIPGASDVFERGFITYTNRSKSELLGVPDHTLAAFGAVSEPTARAMVAGVLTQAPADLAVATTGVAGPGGGSADKPVGTVHLAVARRDGAVTVRREQFDDLGRPGVQMAAVHSALEMLLDALS